MPKFYTDLENHNGLQPDEEGRDYADIDAAVREAGNTAGAVLSDDLMLGRTPVSIKLFVENEERERCATIAVEARIERGE